MSLPNTIESLRKNLTELGVVSGTTLMVHSALGQVGYTVGGPAALIRALLGVLKPGGTLVMPCETPQQLDPAQLRDPRLQEDWYSVVRDHLPLFDPETTPTTLGAVPEAFRTWPGTRRSRHPLVSVCANGALAGAITSEHPLPFGEGPGSPFEKLYEFGAKVLLLGVGFDRCTLLHYAESRCENRRTTVHRYAIEERGRRVWVENPDMGYDDGEHFPVVGERFMATGAVTAGKVGNADALLFDARKLVSFAEDYFRTQLR